MWQHPGVADNPRKLLIVEDDPGIQSQLRWCFEDYEVIAATDRESAINELRRHEPPVVLQDLGLPTAQPMLPFVQRFGGLTGASPGGMRDLLIALLQYLKYLHDGISRLKQGA